MNQKSMTPNSGEHSRTDESQRRLAIAREAVRDALDEHRRMGRSVPTLRDGKVVWLNPDEIGEQLEKMRAEDS